MKPPSPVDRSSVAPGVDLSSCNVKDLQKFKQWSIAQGSSKHSLSVIIRHLLRCFFLQIILPVFHTYLQSLLGEAQGTIESPIWNIQSLFKVQD